MVGRPGRQSSRRRKPKRGGADHLPGEEGPAPPPGTSAAANCRTAAHTSIAALDSIPVTVLSAPVRVIWVDDRFAPRLAWSTVVVNHFLSWTVLVDAQSAVQGIVQGRVDLWMANDSDAALFGRSEALPSVAEVG